LKETIPKLVVLLDEGTPILAADPFINHGHQAIYHGDVLSPGSRDELVAAAAIMNNPLLIAFDRDMKQMAKRFGNPDKDGKFKKLHLLFINCNPVLGPKRLEHFMSYIEHEWQITCKKASRSLWIDVGPHYIRTYR
jgi:predicted nuclease of predicted toxin-antitoxin system